jgi:hypothetical protein
MLPKSKSLLEEKLPADVILVIFDHLAPSNCVCFALCSSYFWNLYLSLKPRIPSLWTPTVYIPSQTSTKRAGPPGYSSDHGQLIPLGAFLTEWIGLDKYRMLRPAGYMPSHLHVWTPEHLPPFFIRRTWQEKVGIANTDHRLIDSYHAYWHVERDGNKILPHPRETEGMSWEAAAKQAMIKDVDNWERTEDWEQWWSVMDRRRFYGLGKNELSNVRKGFREQQRRAGSTG